MQTESESVIKYDSGSDFIPNTEPDLAQAICRMQTDPILCIEYALPYVFPLKLQDLDTYRIRVFGSDPDLVFKTG